MAADMEQRAGSEDTALQAMQIDEPSSPAAAMATDESSLDDFEVTGFAKGEYTYNLPNFKSLIEKKDSTKHFSEEFEIAGYSWRLLVFPAGNPTANRTEPWISCYLEASDAKFLPHALLPNCKFKLIAVNHQDPAQSTERETHHTFTHTENDWGFTTFMSIETLHGGAYLKDDTLSIKVVMEVQLEDKFTGATKTRTGFVGLKNQGATCYMNSLLQMFYHMPRFRQAVFQMPTTETEDPKKSISLSLKNMFYNLQYASTPVSTKDLISSFGWGTADAFQQHDVEELELKLCEKLEEKMKNTKLDKMIDHLLKGSFNQFITCTQVDFTSERSEEFLDIQLDIMGCKGLHESFEKLTLAEMLDGDNKYMAEGHGLQDAKKGVLIETLPPILQLHLRRFDYDRTTFTPIKVNDRYEFYEELDLDIEDGKYLSAKADRSIRQLYKLHSVLVHSGGSHGGHYYAYIRPDGEKWYKFDDEAVTLEESSAAIEGQFGGEPEAVSYNRVGGRPKQLRNMSNAYMLVYVRVSDWDSIACGVGEQDLQDHVRTRLQREQAEKARKRKEKLQAHRFVTIKVATDADIQRHVATEAFDLVRLDALDPAHVLKVPKTATWGEVQAQLAAVTGVPAEAQCFRRWSVRDNFTLRPKDVMPIDVNQQVKFLHREQLQTASQTRGARHLSKMVSQTTTLAPIELYLAPPAKAQADTPYILLMLKVYNPHNASLSFWQPVEVPVTATLEILVQHCLSKLTLDTDTPAPTGVSLFEEVRHDHNVVTALDTNMTFKAKDLSTGDIVIAQIDVPEAVAATLPYPCVTQYLEYRHSLRTITFAALGTASPADLPTVTLDVAKNASYDEVSAALAEKLTADCGVAVPDPQLLRFTLRSAYTLAPQRVPVRHGEDLVQSCQAPGAAHHIYYELLDMPLPLLEQLKTMKVRVVKANLEVYRALSLRMPKGSTVDDLLAKARQELGTEFASGCPLRCVQISRCMVYGVLEGAKACADLDTSYWDVRIEPVPEDDAAAARAADAAGLAPVPVFLSHCALEAPLKTVVAWGEPCVIVVQPGESVESVKARVQARLNVPPEKFDLWQFATVAIPQPEHCTALSDAAQPILEPYEKAVQAVHATNHRAYVGMLHEGKTHRAAPPRGHAEAQLQLL